MANEQLNDYIQKARKSGMSDEQIKNELTKAGWLDNQVRDGLAGLTRESIHPILKIKSKRSPVVIGAAVLIALIIIGGGAYGAYYYLAPKSQEAQTKSAPNNSDDNDNKVVELQSVDVNTETWGNVNLTTTLLSTLPLNACYRLSLESFARDGQKAAYVLIEGENSYAVVNKDQWPGRNYIFGEEQSSFFPIFYQSPTGKYLGYFATNGATSGGASLNSAEENIFLVFNGQERGPFTAPPFLAFSNDGAHFAYPAVSSDKRVLVVDSEEYPLPDVDYDAAGWPIFTPDGTPGYSDLGGVWLLKNSTLVEENSPNVLDALESNSPSDYASSQSYLQNGMLIIDGKKIASNVQQIWDPVRTSDDGRYIMFGAQIGRGLWWIVYDKQELKLVIDETSKNLLEDHESTAAPQPKCEDLITPEKVFQEKQGDLKAKFAATQSVADCGALLNDLGWWDNCIQKHLFTLDDVAVCREQQKMMQRANQGDFCESVFKTPLLQKGDDFLNNDYFPLPVVRGIVLENEQSYTIPSFYRTLRIKAENGEIVQIHYDSPGSKNSCQNKEALDLGQTLKVGDIIEAGGSALTVCDRTLSYIQDDNRLYCQHNDVPGLDVCAEHDKYYLKKLGEVSVSEIQSDIDALPNIKIPDTYKPLPEPKDPFPSSINLQDPITFTAVGQKYEIAWGQTTLGWKAELVEARWNEPYLRFILTPGIYSGGKVTYYDDLALTQIIGARGGFPTSQDFQKVKNHQLFAETYKDISYIALGFRDVDHIAEGTVTLAMGLFY